MSGTTQHMDKATHAALSAKSRLDREFARARRHSSLVRMLRIGLPIVSVLMVGGGLAVTWLARVIPETVSIESASLDDRGIVMKDPRMSGFDKNNRPYSMIAERAIQALGGGGVDLETVRAKIAISSSATADIVAEKGHYDPTAERLRLADSIRVATSDGMTIALKAAEIDLKTGSMSGSGPVEIVSPTQTIKAGSLNVRDHGAGITFGNRVSLTIRPSSTTTQPSDKPSSDDKPRPLDFSSIELR